jgi:curved DNA-binding protein CbpA
VKSAYRKLARLRHPDVNGGSERAAREFALLSRAYHVLSDPQERAHHDQQLDVQSSPEYSILHSTNPHAQRARNLAVQARWDRVVNEVLEKDREESRERQRAVFTCVSLFLSTFFIALLKPNFWEMLNYAGRAIVLTLFVIGVWHLASRLREYFAHYTYKPKSILDSLMQEDETPEQPFTRSSALAFLVVGYALSISVGLLISWHTQGLTNGIHLALTRQVANSNMLFASSAMLLIPDLVVYPPIAVLIVDSMQALTARMD